MRAVIVDPEVEGGLRLGDAPDPVPGEDQVLVEVHNISLNFGDLSAAARQSPGSLSGWDAARHRHQSCSKRQRPGSRHRRTPVTSISTAGPSCGLSI